MDSLVKNSRMYLYNMTRTQTVPNHVISWYVNYYMSCIMVMKEAMLKLITSDNFIKFNEFKQVISVISWLDVCNIADCFLLKCDQCLFSYDSDGCMVPDETVLSKMRSN